MVHMKQAINPVFRDDCRDHDDERSGRSADLNAGTAQKRNQEPGDYRAIDARLGRKPRRNREGHGQGQGDQSDGDTCGEVGKEILNAIVPQAEDRLGQPLVHRKNRTF